MLHTTQQMLKETYQYKEATAAKLFQSCLTLCEDCSLPGFSIHGILQARTLEWVAISFSKEATRSSQ